MTDLSGEGRNFQGGNPVKKKGTIKLYKIEISLVKHSSLAPFCAKANCPGSLINQENTI